jgi:hypothetical protein
MPDTRGSEAKSPLEIRKSVLADPMTAKIAAKLGIPLEEYAEGIVHFAMNPDELPEYVGVTDEVLKEKFGLEPSMKADEITKVFDTQVKYATHSDTTDYRDAEAKAKPVELSSSPAQLETQDAALKKELDRQRFGKKGGNS